MSLADALKHQRELGIHKGPDCKLCVLLRSLGEDDAAALEAALVDEGITGAAISRALRDESHDIAPNVVIRHRKGECRRR